MQLKVVGNVAHAHIVDGEPRKSFTLSLRGEQLAGGLPGAALDFVTLDDELAKKYSAGAAVEISLGEPVPAPPPKKPTETSDVVEDAEDTDE